MRNPRIELLMGWTLQVFLEVLASIITDGVLVCEWTRLITGCSWQDQIFRCWTVYNRSWQIAVLPFLLLLYNIANLLVVTYWNIINFQGTSYSTGIAVSPVAATITINIYATCEWIDCAAFYDINSKWNYKVAISFHIWRKCRLSRRLARFSIRVIVESGSLYTISTIVTFGTVFLTDSLNGYAIATAIVCHQWIKCRQDYLTHTRRVIALQELLLILYWYGWHKIGLIKN